MKNEHLHLLIDEEIYLVKSQASKPQAASDELPEEELSVDSQQSTEKSKIENPPIEASQKVKFAFIHNSDQQAELELLNNIIGACKLEVTNFKIIKEGEYVNYENAVVFTNEANQFYAPINNDQIKVLYSKPLTALLNSKEEKGELWGALQEFVR